MTTATGDRGRGVVQNILLAVTSVLVLALGAEAALQIVVPIIYRPRVTLVHPVLGWTHRPSVSVTDVLEGYEHRATYNAHGYRVPEHTLERSDARRRVVVLGDSFVDGAEVDDREVHTVLLEQAMTDVEVINLGVYGYSTTQELLTLDLVGLRYQPDLVVLVTIQNDFFDNLRNFSDFGPTPRYRIDADSLVLEPIGGPASEETFRATNLPAPFMAFLHRRSLVYYMLNHHIYQRIFSARIAELMASQHGAVTGQYREELYRRLVLRMRSLAGAAGADFLVVFAYTRGEVRGNESSPRADLAQVLSTDGVTAVDLFEGLRRAELSGSTSLWYQEDIHWSASGHRTVAELLRPIVEQSLERGGAAPAPGDEESAEALGR